MPIKVRIDRPRLANTVRFAYLVMMLGSFTDHLIVTDLSVTDRNDTFGL